MHINRVEEEKMQKPDKLNIGLICSNGIYDEITKEILNHQGIIFNDIITSKRRGNFPCVILPKYTNERYEVAAKNCADKDGIIIAEKEIPSDLILKALSGQLDVPSTHSINPMINQYESDLVAKIKERYADLGLPLIRKWFWPHFQNACCVITHDLDWFHYSPWHWAVLWSKSIPQVIKLAYQSILKRKNFGNNVSEIVLAEFRRNIKSSFFFLPRYEEVYQEKFLRYLKQLQELEFEVGLHGYYSHDNLARLKEQKATLEKYVKTEVKGIRQHELNFRAPLTWKLEEEAGFIYDLSFSYNNKFGFRNGICLPYHPIDILENRRFSILEMPTSFMDWTILHKKMNCKEAMDTFAMVRENTDKFNGLLVTCFHNTYLNKETFPEIDKLYSFILDDLTQRNYWITKAKECCQWWLQRENTKISLTIRDIFLKGRTNAYPIPLVIENIEGEKKFVEIHEHEFRIKIG